MPGNLNRDPILEAYRIWIEHGWSDSAAGLAAVTSIERVHQVLMKRADQILAPINLTFSRYEVLSVLYFSDGSLPLSQVGKLLQLHQTSITNLVDKLEAQDLIVRRPHPTDRRSTIAQITVSGKDMHRKAIRRLNAELFTHLGLSDDEVKLLISVLAKMRHSWGDFTDDPEWDAFEAAAGLPRSDSKPTGTLRRRAPAPPRGDSAVTRRAGGAPRPATGRTR